MTVEQGKSKPHVLFLPSFYMDPDKPVLGIFFKEQTQAVRMAGMRVGVGYVEPRSLRAFRIRALIKNHGQITTSEEDGLPTMRLHGWNPLLNTFIGGWIWSLATYYLVGRYVKRFGRPDIIHAHNAQWAGFAAYQVWRRMGIPYVITEHHSRFLTGNVTAMSKYVSRKAYRHASKVIVVSNALGKSIQPLLDGKVFCVVPNCVDTNYYYPPPSLPSMSKYTFLAVAHFSSNKGFDILLRSFAARFRNDASVFLKIGGDGAIKRDLMALCEELGISNQVQFLGALSKGGVRAAMWEANAFILSSFHETFGVVLIEAMSTGLPVIATRSGGPNDVVTKETGVLVEPGNIVDLSEAMHVVRDGRYFTRDEIRGQAISKYGYGVIADRLENMYKNVLVKSC